MLRKLGQATGILDSREVALFILVVYVRSTSPIYMHYIW